LHRRPLAAVLFAPPKLDAARERKKAHLVEKLLNLPDETAIW
jgi:hypothetical protein